MPEAEPKKIVYLFGAGATHAELTNLYEDLVPEKLGLLTSSVSERVIEKARHGARYLKGLEMVSAASGSLNIELLISLVENSKIYGWEYKTQRLKMLVKEDIKEILTASRIRRFYLHRALLELHKQEMTETAKTKEKLIGLISLNYDDVLDRAYKEYYGQPNYCFSLAADAPWSKHIPLLKLHGSFNWSRKMIRGKPRRVEIIPLGSNKQYMHAPYGFIWSRALEILIECDTLRVIGCSLSQNDTHLIDLLFKAHLERDKDKVLEIEIISSTRTGDRIKHDYGFFPGIKTLTGIPELLFPEAVPPRNAFKIWLKYKSISMLGEDTIKGTRYLKKVVK